MLPVLNENIYDLALISKIKVKTGSKKLKKIVKNLRNLEKENTKKLSELKIKIFEEKKEEIEEPEFKVIAPIIGFNHYFEDLKKSTSKLIVNKDAGIEGKIAPSIVEVNEEELRQIDSSDFSMDE